MTLVVLGIVFVVVGCVLFVAGVVAYRAVTRSSSRFSAAVAAGLLGVPGIILMAIGLSFALSDWN